MDILVSSVAAILLLAILIAVGFLFRRWRRNAYRFSLRGLLFIFVVVACALFVAIRFVVPTINHRWAVYNIDRYGQIVFLNDWDAGGITASNKSFNRWRDVEIVHVATDADASDLVTQLRSLPEVAEVSLGARVTDVGLEAICQLKDHPSFEELQLLESSITDDGFSRVTKLQQLKGVHINTCPIGDAALEHLKSIPKLQMLMLTEEGPKANPRRFSPVGFAAIGQLKELTSLQLIRLQVSDVSARHLTALKQLKKLDFSICRISPEALAAIRQALPDCEVTVFDPQQPAQPTPTGK